MNEIKECNNAKTFFFNFQVIKEHQYIFRLFIRYKGMTVNEVRALIQNSLNELLDLTE